MIHARWDRDEGSRYGAPMFASARKAYKRMTQGELDIAIRRKTRAGMRYVHVLDGASPAEIEAYKAANRPALDDPYAAVADFFFNKAGGLQALQGDARLSDIDDVLHHVDTFGIASPVPLELIGYGPSMCPASHHRHSTIVIAAAREMCRAMVASPGVSAPRRIHR
jgi:hypothetical protein